jgi:nucleoside-diphosphate-sugar epimerase
MQLLIIGGTRFLGRALVDAAQEAGHQVTLFNRGRSNPEICTGKWNISKEIGMEVWACCAAGSGMP